MFDQTNSAVEQAQIGACLPEGFARQVGMPPGKESAEQVKMIDMAIATLQTTLAQLESRLQPALRPMPPTASVGKEPSPNGSPMLMWMRTIHGRIQDCNGHLQDLMSRLDM